MVLTSLLLVSCATKTDVSTCLPNENISGFWSGVWHGIIMVPNFIGTFIWDDVSIYDINNNGKWYDFGFVGGLGFCLRFLQQIIRFLFK